MKVFFSFVILSFLGLAYSDKSPCQGCTDAVDGILKGLDATKNKNFGGGDTAWEEKNNLKYKTSEVRLAEVLETACSKDNFQCNKVLSDQEDEIEEWYKTMQDEKPLQEFLCIDTAKVCCPAGKFGEDCADCPQNSEGKICFGRGTCEGSGDKQGSGKCVCNDGYAGDSCNECGSGHFSSFSNDTYTLCSLCHHTCETCTGPSAEECTTCKAGFREETSGSDDDKKMTCVDVNECVEQAGICSLGTYCANTEGSYTCEDWKCHPLCARCYGPTNKHCFECISGTIMRQPFTCQDIDECASGAMCLGMYEVCVNTPGHYKCECARFFKRDEATGQCQPDPAIYSQYLPPSARRAAEAKKEEEKKEEPKEEAKAEDTEAAKEEGADDAVVEEKKEEL